MVSLNSEPKKINKMNLRTFSTILLVEDIAAPCASYEKSGSVSTEGRFRAIMKSSFYLGLTVATLMTGFAADSTDDGKAVQGDWKPVKADLGGQYVTDDVLKTISLKLKNGYYEVVVGDHPDRGTYTLDAATKPKRMTVTGTEGPNRGRTFPAIYELKGNVLRICYDLSGAKRPTKFKSVAGTKLYLVTYHRKKE
jgi:uncharacterized protein (TIGR03067 family)